MAVGDIERMVEGLVNRGLVSPKMVGRTVGQATIDELQNLGSNIAQSQATRQSEQEKRINMIKSQVVERQGQQNKGLSFNRSVGGIKDPTKPFVVGHTKGSGTAPSYLSIATPTSKGIQIKSHGYSPAGLSGQAPSDLNALVKLALENTGISATDPYSIESVTNTGLNIPQINTVYHGSANYSNLNELMAEIAKQTKDVSAVKKIFGGI